MSFQNISEDMEFLEQWEDRMAYVIDLGKALEPLDPSLCNELTRVEGCASQVWLVPSEVNGKLSFAGASDAMIVQGLIAVLLSLVNYKTPQEILELDVKECFNRLGLAAHLSGQRSNGLAAMINRIRNIAQKAQNRKFTHE